MELLSPAGDLNNFYTAIKSGADAVYLGLNKFNARMKADNISIDNIENVVSYAHLKGVKVYITLNTLVSDKEIPEVVDMVGTCLRAGVDAFIVQDYGIIGVLKNVYPNIVLHGSTQLGVHNIRGARVAKELGLVRVVLSREVTLSDIREIANNVDIELEVFVHGAMCVCFSGNCYLSSIKCGASGNRGECKQLCRLPYTLSNGKMQKSGYMISPRDNCMIDKLLELQDAGVVSLKIEGRLRRQGYVNIATRVYREALDELYDDGNIKDVSNKISTLKDVFSRGNFIQGYFDTNNIIDTANNSHMGQYVGNVVKCKKFKDLYQIENSTNANIHSGDGLKIIGEDGIVTLGVGNVEINGKNIVVYGRNYVQSGSRVYRVLNKELEDKEKDLSRYITIEMNFCAKKGKACSLTAIANGCVVSVCGNIPQEAKIRSLTKDSVIEQLYKLGEDKEYFKLMEVSCDIDDGLFLPVSELNRLRRDVLDSLKDKIVSTLKPNYEIGDISLLNKFESIGNIEKSSYAIIDEKYDIRKLSQNYDGVILSPTVYSLDVLDRCVNKIRKDFDNDILLNMPIIALSDDLKVLDKLVEYCVASNIGIVANNIYALDYIRQGAEVFVGCNMNICNKYAVTTLSCLGVKECVASIEKWCNPPVGLFKMCEGKRVLMTFAHCPSKTLTGKDCDCGECGYISNMTLKGDGGEYSIRRYRVKRCYFELVDSRYENKSSQKSIDDKRE